EDSDGRQDSPAGELPKRVQQPTESEPVTINIQDLLSCSNFAVQHRYLFEDDNLLRSTQKLSHSTKPSGSPLEEKHDQCKCENLIMFQNLANEEVRKLTQRYILFLYYASVCNANNIIKTSYTLCRFYQLKS
ncbi:MATN2 isoform 18, partial [Pongo abelii]